MVNNMEVEGKFSYSKGVEKSALNGITFFICNGN